MPDDVIVDRAGAVATITMHRPGKLNAFTGAMRVDLLAALQDAGGDERVRAVVLQGAGSAFGAGQDLSNVADGADLGALLQSEYVPIIRSIRTMPKPVIAAVRGVAAGAAANLALACDIVVATESARFIQAFIRIGLLPDVGGTWILPRLIGLARARAIAMLGLPVGGRDAAAWGMIWRAVPDDQLDAEIDALTASLVALPTDALAAVKQAFEMSGDHTLDEQLALESALQTPLGYSDDFREGRQAFLDKRPPQFGIKPNR